MSTTKRDTIDMAREIAAEYSKAERFQTWTHDYMMERLMELVTVSVAAEREACAKVCDDALTKIWEYHSAEVKHAAGNVCNNLAAAIRNRGNS